MNPKTFGIATAAVLSTTFASQIAQLANVCQDIVTTCQHNNQKDEDKIERYIVTKAWLSTEEHENAVVIDIKRASMDAGEALMKLHLLYPGSTDIIGVRSLNDEWLNIVFANRDLVDKALLEGFRLDEKTTIYGTKALDATHPYTLLTIKGLPILSKDATKMKIESSMESVFGNILMHSTDADLQPAVVDHLFHQKPVGFYSGTVTVVIRGQIYLFQRTLRLDGFDGDFACKTSKVYQFCHHCQRFNVHLATQCPDL
jgi:hypothetical protein